MTSNRSTWRSILEKFIYIYVSDNVLQMCGSLLDTIPIGEFRCCNSQPKSLESLRLRWSALWQERSGRTVHLS